MKAKEKGVIVGEKRVKWRGGGFLLTWKGKKRGQKKALSFEEMWGNPTARKISKATYNLWLTNLPL